MSQTDKEKLEILLNYWVRHNRQHGEELRRWAEKGKRFGQVKVHNDILKAVQQIDKANEFLLRALEKLKEGKR